MTDVNLFGDVSLLDTGERSEFDYYPTPAWMTRSLLQFHPAIAGASVLEPCSGDGAIVRVLEAAGCQVRTNDFDRRHPAETHWNAALAEYWQMWAPRVDWVITNPPFTIALDVLRPALERADLGVIMLLRKTFLEPTDDRGPWLQAHPPTRLIGQPRYSFRGTGSDSVSCDWCIWERRPDRALAPMVIDYLADRRTR
jgi:hypothetical protein